MANSKIKFRYGICQNSHMEETGKPCPLCQSKEAQRIIATKEFICSECKGKLKEIPRPPTFWEKYGKLIIAAVVILLIGGGFGIHSLLSGSKGPKAIKLAQKELVMKVGETQVITPTVEPEGEKVTFTFKAQGKVVKTTSGGEITALKKGEATILVKCEENPDIRALCKVKVEEPIAEPQLEQQEPEATEPEEAKKEEPKEEPKTEDTKKKEGTGTGTSRSTGMQNGMGTKVYSYGKYAGNLKNGVPDGTGKLTFTKAYQLNSEYTAQPGEYIQGIFENGKPTFVTYYQKDGTVTKIKLR